MKRPFIFLITLIIYFSISLGIGVPFALWLPLKDTNGVDFVSYAIFGAAFGAVCGMVVWAMYLFNMIHRR